MQEGTWCVCVYGGGRESVLQDGAVSKDSQAVPSPNPSPNEATLIGFRFQGLAGCPTTTGKSAGGWEQLQFRQIPPFPLPWEGRVGPRNLCC